MPPSIDGGERIDATRRRVHGPWGYRKTPPAPEGCAAKAATFLDAKTAEWRALYGEDAPRESRVRRFFAARYSAPVRGPAQCYLDRYADLRAAFCDPAPCDVARARRHWRAVGAREGRAFRCPFASQKRRRDERPDPDPRNRTLAKRAANLAAFLAEDKSEDASSPEAGT